MRGTDPTHGWRWIVLAAVAGLVASAALTTVLALDRRAFVAGWAIVVLLVWAVYARAEHVSLRVLLSRHRIVSLLFGAAAGAWLAFTVGRQPASDTPTGLALVADLLWLGVVYGIVDALMLSVLPVVALYGERPTEPRRRAASRSYRAGAALLGSAIVTATYHAGFREFQGPQLIQPVIGNLVSTIAYLLSGNALAPMLAHVIMHVAAVLHGAATTSQLPPHY